MQQGGFAQSAQLVQFQGQFTGGQTQGGMNTACTINNSLTTGLQGNGFQSYCQSDCYQNQIHHYHHYYPVTQFPHVQLSREKMKIEKAENGFKVFIDNKEYVFEKLENLLKFIRDELCK